MADFAFRWSYHMIICSFRAQYYLQLLKVGRRASRSKQSHPFLSLNVFLVAGLLHCGNRLPYTKNNRMAISHGPDEHIPEGQGFLVFNRALWHLFFWSMPSAYEVFYCCKTFCIL